VYMTTPGSDVSSYVLGKTCLKVASLLFRSPDIWMFLEDGNGGI